MVKLFEEAIFKRNVNIGDVVCFVNEANRMNTRRITVSEKETYLIELNGKNIFSNENFDVFLKRVQEITSEYNLKMNIVPS